MHIPVGCLDTMIKRYIAPFIRFCVHHTMYAKAILRLSPECQDSDSDNYNTIQPTGRDRNQTNFRNNGWPFMSHQQWRLVMTVERWRVVQRRTVLSPKMVDDEKNCQTDSWIVPSTVWAVYNLMDGLDSVGWYVLWRFRMGDGDGDGDEGRKWVMDGYGKSVLT